MPQKALSSNEPVGLTVALTPQGGIHVEFAKDGDQPISLKVARDLADPGSRSVSARARGGTFAPGRC